MKRSFAVLAIGVVISLGFAACDSGPNSPETDASALPDFMAGAGGDNKVAVCHVGTEQPAYDPACNPEETTCGDAGKVDLLFLPASIAAKHLEQGHDGQLVDYDPLAVGATGEGQEDTSDDGKYVDDGCVIPGEPEEEIIYAVAYIDVVDDGGGYDPDTDHLIAKLVEASGDGTPGAGDKVVTESYPKDVVWPSDVGNFQSTVHEITGCTFFSPDEIIRCEHDGEHTVFKWSHVPFDIEDYMEAYIGEKSTAIQDAYHMGIFEGVLTTPGSPSMPDEQLLILGEEDPADNQFIDVEVRLPD